MFSNKLFLLVMMCPIFRCVDMMVASETASAPYKDYKSIAGTNSLYKVHMSPATFFDANKTCSDEGAALFYPETQDESIAVLSYLINNFEMTLPYSLHVGLRSKGFSLKTLDGTFIDATSMKWLKWYPTNYVNRKCLQMTYLLNAKVQLKNMQCILALPFICKSKNIDLKQESSSQKSHWESDSSTVSDSSSRDDESATTTEIMITPETASTPNPEDYNSIAGTNSLYKFHKSPATFFDANRTCSDEGGSLFYPETQNESIAVLTFLTNHFEITLPYNLHVGLQSKGFRLKTLEGTFIDVTHMKWLKWYPTNNVNRKCLHMTYLPNAKIQLKNMQCILALPFICKSNYIDPNQESSSQKPHSESTSTTISVEKSVCSYGESTTDTKSSSQKSHAESTSTTVFITSDVESTTTSDFDEVKSATFADFGEVTSTTTLGGVSSKTNENEKVHALKSRNYFYVPQTQGLYKFHLTAATFEDAKTTCENDGASLYYPETEHESNTVTTFMQKYKGAKDAYGWYVGLVRSGNNFIPSNGISESNTYTKWNTGEPNNADGSENCVVFIAEPMKMNDVPCTYQFYYICKWQPSTRDVESTTTSDSSSSHDESTTGTDTRYESTTTSDTSASYDESTTKPEPSWTTWGEEFIAVTTTEANPVTQRTDDSDVEITTQLYVNTTIRNINNSRTAKSISSPIGKGYNFIPGTESLYKLHKTPSNFTDAEKICSEEGSMLFYPETDEEIKVVLRFFKNNYAIEFPYNLHIGSQSKEYLTNNSDVDYIQQNTSEYDKKCVAMTFLPYDTTLFKLKPCFSLRPFICKTRISGWNGVCNVTDDGYGYAEQLGKCYKFHLTPRNWNDARLQCHAENAELAVINSREEAAYLVRLTSSIPKMRIPNSFRHGVVLLGFHNIDVKDWQTVQGTSLYYSGYACWGNRQPDGGERNRCGSMFYNGHLNDIACDQKAFFICEHNVVNYEHEPPPQFAAQKSLQCYDDI